MQCEDSDNTYFHIITTACCIWRASAKHWEKTELKLFLLPYKLSICVATEVAWVTSVHCFFSVYPPPLFGGRQRVPSISHTLHAETKPVFPLVCTHTPFISSAGGRVSGDGQAAALFWVWNTVSIPYGLLMLCEISKLVLITQYYICVT